MKNKMNSTAPSPRPNNLSSLIERLDERLNGLNFARNAAGRSLVGLLAVAALALFALTPRGAEDGNDSYRIESASRLAGQTAAANQLPTPTFEVASETGTAQSNSVGANTATSGAEQADTPQQEKPTLAVLASRLGKSTSTTAPAAPTTAAPTTKAPTTTAAPTTAAPTSEAETTVVTEPEAADATVVVEVDEANGETTVTTVEDTTTTTEAPTTTAAPTTAAGNGWVDAGHGVAVPPILLAIRRCESTDNYLAANRYSSARGAYQFLTGSWKAYGHAKRYGVSQAHLATPAQQDEAALITWQADGTRPWNASKHCWG